MAVRNFTLYFEDILESAQKILLYTKGMKYDKFISDSKTVDAVIRNFEIIGEAARQLPKSVKDNHADIEWKAIIAFRNVVVHEYFVINHKIMWDIIRNKIPSLTKAVEDILIKGK